MPLLGRGSAWFFVKCDFLLRGLYCIKIFADRRSVKAWRGLVFC